MPKRLQKELVALCLQKYKNDRKYFIDSDENLMKKVIEWLSMLYVVI